MTKSAGASRLVHDVRDGWVPTCLVVSWKFLVGFWVEPLSGGWHGWEVSYRKRHILSPVLGR